MNSTSTSISTFRRATPLTSSTASNRQNPDIPTISPSLFSPKYEEVFRKAHGNRVLVEMTPRTLISKITQGNVAMLNGLFAVSNSTAAGAILDGANAVANVTPALRVMSVAGGVLAVTAGLNFAGDAAVKLSSDYQNGNWEGGFDHGVFGLIGTGFATLGGSMITSGIAAHLGATAIAATAGLTATVTGLVTYGLIGIWSTYGLAVNHTFRSRLEERLGDQGDAALLPAMIWLASQVREGENEAALQTKWDEFAFRTSEAACRLVREKITPEFLTLLKAGNPDAIETAKFIVSEVKRANAKQLVKNYLFMAITLIGIAAFVCLLVFATGPYAPLLFAIASVLWLGIDPIIQEKLGDLICGKSEIQPPQLEKSSIAKIPLSSLNELFPLAEANFGSFALSAKKGFGEGKKNIEAFNAFCKKNGISEAIIDAYASTEDQTRKKLYTRIAMTGSLDDQPKILALRNYKQLQ